MKAVLIRMPHELAEKVDAEAERVSRSRNNFVNWVLRQWCDPDAVTIEDNHLVDALETYEVDNG